MGLTMQPAPNHGTTVYYDGGCPLCRAEIDIYQKSPGGDRVCWVDASACSDQDLGPALNRSDALARLHVRQADGALASGARAFVQIWAVLPKWRWLASLARIPGAIQVMEWGYVLFLKVRPLWRKASKR